MQDSLKGKIIAILGPTATGKTELGIELAKMLNGEIVSCDSMQVYKYMNIGTAKPKKEELKGVNYHLIDIVFPDEEFNAGIYEKLAKKKIREIDERGNIPIVVGGTGLYFRALRHGLHNIPKSDDVRRELEKRAEKQGLPALFEELRKYDPSYAERISPTDKKRIIRALEVIRISGKRFSELSTTWEKVNEFARRFIVFVLYKERNILYRDIDRRVEKMIQEGLIEEVKDLLNMGYKRGLNSLSAIGYKEIIEHLEGAYPLQEAVKLIKRNTHKYAKRQFTWFRKEKDAIWVEAKDRTSGLQTILSKLEIGV